MNATVCLLPRCLYIPLFQSSPSSSNPFVPTLSDILTVSFKQHCGRCLQGLLCPYQPKVKGDNIQICGNNILSRVKNPDVGIEAHKGRSNVEVISVSASAPRAEGEMEEADKNTEEEEEITRKRRNGLSTDQEQPQQSRLSNVFIPDEETEEEAEEDIWEGQDYEYDEDDLFLSRDGADIDIGKLNMEERLKVSSS